VVGDFFEGHGQLPGTSAWKERLRM
jgi:hypothetical protein